MSLLWDTPFREISLVRNGDRDYYFSFEDLNTPTIPIFSEVGGATGLSRRSLYDFPIGTEFKFRAADDVVDIRKTGEYNIETKEVKISFKAADTSHVSKDRRVYYEMDCIFPDGSRYPLLAGYLSIFATRRLNE